MATRDEMTIQALRSDVALKVARFILRSGQVESTAARRLGVPPSMLRRIMRGRVSRLSLDYLLRLAVRAGCPLVLQTGRDPAEAGAYLSVAMERETRPTKSPVFGSARDAIADRLRELTPTQRLELQFKLTQLVFRRSAANLRDRT